MSASSRLDKYQAEVKDKAPDEVLKTATQLIKERVGSDERLAAYLSRVKQEVLHPGTFDEWLEDQGLARSTGLALIQTFDALVLAQVPTETMDAVGWSKARVIASRLQEPTSKKAKAANKKLLEAAKELKREPLKAWLKAQEEPKPSKEQAYTKAKRKQLVELLKLAGEAESAEAFMEAFPDCEILVEVVSMKEAA